ncbi:PAS domain-containing sensor histidine kinase [Aquamicrobium sp. LC103]|uniref:sensor histidine kinase n=1 Tax=Aquamicrobium sp. LC103 TaxID=1120658 RepID=UPI000A946E66|nr:PAS domain-containing sensor histidine kinase [Aquamicrobium sp. LC103]TKT75303.1 histidine kinase [Aquamicrobium sp. LC103]
MNIHSSSGTVEVGRSLVRALRNTGIIVIYQNVDLDVTWAQNVPLAWSSGDLRGQTDREFMPENVAERIIELKKAVLSSGMPQKFEFRDGMEDGGRWFDMWIDADHDEDGATFGIVSTIVETTEQKHREQTLRTLLREVSHRSKNLLAIILSIATQTGRYSGSIEVFLKRFRGRIQSLASSQDLVTSSNWRGATLSELIEGQVSRYCEDPGYSVRFEGVDPYLNPNAALHIGLALHELVVNSMSHGALSRPDGHVSLKSTLTTAEGGSRSLVLEWDERTEFKQAPEERRFGSVALERVVPVSLDGRAELSFNAHALKYVLEVPSESFEIL